MEQAPVDLVVDPVVRPASGNAADDWDGDDEDDMEEVAQGSSNMCTDKAYWSEENLYTLCELSCDRIKAENCNNGTMSGRGYKIVSGKYYARTGLRQDKRKLRNRVGILKQFYLFWKMCNNSSGINRGSSGEVIASHHWWKTNLDGKQNKTKLRKLIHGEPDYCPHLEIIFKNVAVDGSTSYIPGEEDEGRKKTRRKKKKRTTSLIFL
ncbi:U3 small nucleolar RNA-associated protein 25-like isoform X2 [Panicum miliaceum]|uniref:U3 small nucleolar RNA-associated protein 25-like isoform X2 n=1 Tax=Panicum miliaceum TaxID=4540 RepID=A0A3L6PWL9_PANMI|nr:U3 small nucleolar RNA-associated protein 25-like isoform X2 [Panicum miliaceum]